MLDTEKEKYLRTGIALLCKEYQLDLIELKFRKSARCWFKTRKRFTDVYTRVWIQFGLDENYHNLDEKLVHEFAHYLTYIKHGHGNGHNRTFFLNLVKVIRDWYGRENLEKYNWKHEYRRIYLWYTQFTGKDK